MGQFSRRPDEPTEWAGLPSEPARPKTAAERLGDAPAADLLGLGALTPEGESAAREFITVEVEPTADPGFGADRGGLDE